MGTLIIRHKVKDYGKWRPMYDREPSAEVSWPNQSTRISLVR